MRGTRFSFLSRENKPIEQGYETFVVYTLEQGLKFGCKTILGEHGCWARSTLHSRDTGEIHTRAIREVEPMDVHHRILALSFISLQSVGIGIDHKFL